MATWLRRPWSTRRVRASHRGRREVAAVGRGEVSSDPSPAKVAYLMSGFPHLTETFILFEMLAVEKQGLPIAIYPLRRAPMRVMHPEAAAILPKVHYHPFLSWPIFCAQAYFLGRRPGAYCAAWWTWLRTTWGSLRYFAGAVVFFPKAVYFARRMQREGVTHVHAHFASHPAAAALVIGRLTGLPYSFTAHGSDLHRERRMLREKVAEAAFVVTISQFNREWIVAACGEAARAKVLLVRCGVDLQVFRPRCPASEGQEEGLVIVCVGTLYEVKGQTYLLEACARLRQRGIPFHCHFVGDGPDRQALVAQAERAGLTAHVTFHGTLRRPEIAAMLQRGEVLVTPSVISRDGRREGLPNVLMEAMACGLPVVASRLSGIPELVEEGRTGFLTPPGDAEAIADALETLARDPELRRRLGAAGRESVQQHHNLERNATRLVSLFRAHGAEERAGEREIAPEGSVDPADEREQPPCILP